MKASDLSELRILREIDRHRQAQGKRRLGTTEWWPFVMRWELDTSRISNEPVPEKVLLAKLRKMADKGLIDGCFCGCRGDLEITADGEALLRAERITA